jgi:hypothetical protein
MCLSAKDQAPPQFQTAHLPFLGKLGRMHHFVLLLTKTLEVTKHNLPILRTRTLRPRMRIWLSKDHTKNNGLDLEPRVSSCPARLLELKRQRIWASRRAAWPTQCVRPVGQQNTEIKGETHCTSPSLIFIRYNSFCGEVGAVLEFELRALQLLGKCSTS